MTTALTLSGPFDPRGARGWQVGLPAVYEPSTDNDTQPRHSPLILLEDGKSLGDGHDLHRLILDEGAGRYSFWKGNLYFSTSDNSDPNSNGRAYTIEQANDRRVLFEL